MSLSSRGRESNLDDRSAIAERCCHFWSGRGLGLVAVAVVIGVILAIVGWVIVIVVVVMW